MAATDGGAGMPEEHVTSEDQAVAAKAGKAGGAGSPAEAGKAGGAGSPAEAGKAGGAGSSGSGAGTRASDRERDAVVQRVQDAFAEGRLDDAEFDQRARAALTARTHAELDTLLADLPAAAGPEADAPAVSGRRPGPGPGKFAIALKSSVRRAGRWRVPERYTTVVYKGGGWLDLRAAELSGPVTTFLAVAYKSRMTILVPPSVRVEMTGFGVTQGAEQEDPGYQLPADAPVIHVRGVAYKGAVEITTRPPERPALRG